MGRPLLPLISVEALTTAALELVDESGDFSFPKLAKKIGVSQSSIYNHVSGRDEILELLRHRIITEKPYPPVDHSEWEGALRVLIRAYRDAFARHPRLAPLLTREKGEAGASVPLKGPTVDVAEADSPGGPSTPTLEEPEALE